MKKRRITLNLDEDIVAALDAMDGRSLSAAANAVLRRAVQDEAHRAALLRWLAELDEMHGVPIDADKQAIDALFDELESGVPVSDASGVA